MVNIIKESSSFVIQGDVNSYPFKDGKISLPLNSLYFVIDESNVISFKQVNDNNTLLSVNINNLQINGEQVTKENLIEKFDAVANGSMGGTKINAGTNITLQPQEDGSITISATGELGGTVAWADVTEKPSTFTPSAHTHLSADITDLQGKLDAKQNTLVSGTNIKTINGQDILGEGNITIEGGTGDVTQEYVDEKLALKVDKTAYEADKATFALKTEIPSIEGLASKEELQNGLEGKQDKGDYALKSELSGKQDTLVSGENIKTINGQTILGSGNIEIQGGGSGISDAPSDDKLYGRKNANWSEIIIPSTDNFATKSEIADMLTKTEASEKYQPKGEYLTEVPSEYVTETELSGKGYLTAVPDEYVTDEELNAKGYATTSQLDGKLSVETYNSDKATFATKEELADKANTSDLSNYLQTSVAESTYAKKSEIPEEYTLPIASDSILGGIKVGAGLSINPGTGVLSATGGGTADSVDWANITSKPDDIVNITDKLAEKLDVSTYNQDKETFALKTEIPNDYLTDADLTDYLTKDEASDTYRQKKIINFNRTNRSTEITNAWANSLNNIGATFQYVSFDEGATYNNVLYCGYRSYDGAGNRKGVGITEIDGKMRSVIFEFSGIDCVATLEDEIDLSDYATTAQLANKVDVSAYTEDKATFALKTELTNLATKEELNLKANTSDLSNYVTTVNAEATYAKKSEIPSLEGYLQTSTADEKYATKTELEGKVDDADIADMATQTWVTSQGYLTAVPAEYITESELDAKGYKKIEYLTQTQYDELPTKEEGVLYVITDAPEVVIPDTSTFATKEELSAKQDTLVSGTNIKTVNGESILGSGDIVIQGGSTRNDVEEVAGIDNVTSDSIKDNAIYIDSNTLESNASTYAPAGPAPIYIANVYIEYGRNLLKVYDKDTLTKTEASTTYALQTALQAALDRIAALEAQVGNISTQLDNINGEVIN